MSDFKGNPGYIQEPHTESPGKTLQRETDIKYTQMTNEFMKYRRQLTSRS